MFKKIIKDDKLLFRFRNMNTVRAICREHGHVIDRYGIMARRFVLGS